MKAPPCRNPLFSCEKRCNLSITGSKKFDVRLFGHRHILGSRTLSFIIRHIRIWNKPSFSILSFFPFSTKQMEKLYFLLTFFKLQTKNSVPFTWLDFLLLFFFRLILDIEKALFRVQCCWRKCRINIQRIQIYWMTQHMEGNETRYLLLFRQTWKVLTAATLLDIIFLK